MAHDGLSIMPHANLIENIGFDGDATHTKSRDSSARSSHPIDLPLAHPTMVETDSLADANLMEKAYVRSLWRKIAARVTRVMSLVR